MEGREGGREGRRKGGKEVRKEGKAGERKTDIHHFLLHI